MGIVLGVSMTPTKIRMVLVEGENADGVIVDEDNFFDVAAGASPSEASTQVLSAILGTREGAAEGGYGLLSAGVTWTDHVEAALLQRADRPQDRECHAGLGVHGRGRPGAGCR